MPWPRIHFGSVVTVSPGVTIEFGERRGRVVGGASVSMSESEEEGEEGREGTMGWKGGGGVGARIVKGILEVVRGEVESL